MLPLWVDLFNYAQLAEQIGVGLWACRDTAPHPKPHCLSKAILRVSNGGKESLAMREKAKKLSEDARKTPGREVAAEVIARLAKSGHS